MSQVYNRYMAQLCKVIGDPSILAVSFQTEGIIDMNEQASVTSKQDTLSLLDRTIKLLNMVGSRVSDRNKMATVVRVFYNYPATEQIAEQMARDG